MTKVASISKDYSEGFDENSDEALVLETCRRIQKELDLWHDKLWKNTTQPDAPVCQRQYCSDVQDRAVAKAISAQKKWAKCYHGWAGLFTRLCGFLRLYTITFSSKSINAAWRRYQGAKGYIHSKSWHKAVHLFLEDLYIVWRSLEGLPVWPSYYAAKLGYGHGGMPTTSIYGAGLGPKLLTVSDALSLCGLSEIRPST